MEGIIYDIHGRPIVSEAVKKEAHEKLQNYVAKHQSRFADWFRANGTVKPPLRYDLSAGEWVWIGG